MANDEHLERLRVAVKANDITLWNQWRKENPNIHPDLRDADISGADLSRADLSEVNLSEAYLSGAHLRGAHLRGAHLRDADLSGAILSGANLTGADLSEADFSNCRFGWTVINDTDLSVAKNLCSATHEGPSSLGIDTLYRSHGDIPDSFLRGAGISNDMIGFIHSLAGSIQFYSCFISYSSKDQNFADRLHADLQAKGVRCWFAPEKLKGGAKLHMQIDEAIRDDVLAKAHPGLPEHFRREFQRSLELQIKNLEVGDVSAEIEGSSLHDKWVDWINSHLGEIRIPK